MHRDAGTNDQELFFADAGYRIDDPKISTAIFGKPAQCDIAGVMSKSVIDTLEKIQINQGNAQ